MPWFKVDDQFADCPKVVELYSKERTSVAHGAIALWTRAGSWSARQLTGGRVPMAIVCQFATKSAAEALVRCGLWERVEEGYMFHDWSDYQPDAEEERAAARDRMRALRKKRKANRSGDVRRTGDERSHDVPDPVPTRPDPTRPDDEHDASERTPKSGGLAGRAPPSADAIYVAQHLYDSIRSHSPEFCAGWPSRRLERKLAGWARDIDVGLRNDGMTVDGCVAAIDYAHRSDDDFWRSNLLSGKKLRKHYQSLLIKATRANHDPNICTIADGDWDWKKHVS